MVDVQHNPIATRELVIAGVILGSQSCHCCWQIEHSHVVLGEWKSMLLSSCITSTHGTMATFCKNPRAMQEWLGKEVDWYLQNNSLYPLDDYNLPCEFSHCPKFPCQGITTISLPGLYYPTNLLATSRGLTHIKHMVITPSKQSKQPVSLLQVLPTGKISLQQCHSRMSQEGTVGWQLSTFAWYLHIMQNRFLLAFNWSSGNESQIEGWERR